MGLLGKVRALHHEIIATMKDEEQIGSQADRERKRENIRWPLEGNRAENIEKHSKT